MTGFRFLLVAGLLLVNLSSGQAADELPGDAGELLQQFQKDVDAIQPKADEQIDARKAKLVREPKALRDSYTKAGKYDEALALHQKVRALEQPQQVEVEWGGNWWPAEVLKRDGGSTFIHYTGWDDSWNEWVPRDRIRPAGRPAGRPDCQPRFQMPGRPLTLELKAKGA
jgi:hypothetical protein